MAQQVIFNLDLSLTATQKTRFNEVLIVLENRVPKLLAFYDLLTPVQQATLKSRCPLIARLLAVFGR